MGGKLKVRTFSQLTSCDWSSVVGSLQNLKEDNTIRMWGNGNGANIIICSDDGYKISLHEPIVRHCTRLFGHLDDNVEDLRDPFGDFVFLLHGVDCDALKALAALLYTGECNVTSTEAKDDLEALLAEGVKLVSKGPTENKASMQAMLAENGFPHFKAPLPPDGVTEEEQYVSIEPKVIIKKDESIDLDGIAADDNTQPTKDKGLKRKNGRPAPTPTKLARGLIIGNDESDDESDGLNQASDKKRPDPKTETPEAESDSGRGSLSSRSSESSSNGFKIRIPGSANSTNRSQFESDAGNESRVKVPRASSNKEAHSTTESKNKGFDSSDDSSDSFEEDDIWAKTKGVVKLHWQGATNRPTTSQGDGSQERSLPDDEAEPQPSTSTQSVEKREGRSIHQRTVDILREMTAENVDDSVAQLREIDLHSYQNLKRFVSAVHDMAVSEGNSSLKKYGRLCVEFQSVGTLDENGASVNFRDLLAGHCAKATNGIYELEGVDQQMVEDICAARPAGGEVDGDDSLLEQSAIARFLGNIRLVAQLYAHGLFQTRTLHGLINHLLDRRDNLSTEGLCILIKAVGQRLAEETLRLLPRGYPDIIPIGAIFQRIEAIVHEETSDRVCGLLLDLIDWRHANDWVLF